MLLRLPTRVRVAVLSSWSISGVQIWSKNPIRLFAGLILARISS